MTFKLIMKYSVPNYSTGREEETTLNDDTEEEKKT